MHKLPPTLLMRFTPLLVTMVVTVMLFLALWLSVTNAGIAQAQDERFQISDCQTVKTVAANECTALVTLYHTTDGMQWRNQSNWLSFGDNAPCDWYGVQCTGDHVTGLQLAANGLSGTLPITIGYLSQLTTLHLENNALTGKVPATLCKALPTLTDGNLGYNGLFTRFKRVNSCLEQIDPDWLTTQTIAPRDLTITAFNTDSLHLSWSPIAYAKDGGYYEIYYRERLSDTTKLHGTTTDKLATGYLMNGLKPGQRYFIGVKAYTPPHGDQVNALRSRSANTIGVTKAISGNVVVSAYFPADNDLSSQIPYVTERFRLGTQVNPNVTVLLLVDGSEKEDTQLLQLQGGEIKVTTAVKDAWGKAELDTSDPAILTWFLQYVRQRYPATKEIVTLMGHGIALAPEVDWPIANTNAAQQLGVHTSAAQGESNQLPALPRDWDDMPNDVTDGGYMSTTDVGEALMAATNNGANPYDIVYFDQCFQGNLDSLYEVHKAANVIVASPNYAWLVAAYDKYITGFSPNLTAEEMATHIINPYQSALDPRHPHSIFWLRSSDIAAIAAAVNKLGDALTAATVDGQNVRIATSVRQSQYVDTTQCGERNLQLGPPDELIGIESFGRQLLMEFAIGDRYGIQAAVEEIRNAMQPIEKQVQVGNPYLAPDEYWDYRDTLTILAPLPRNSPAGVAWRASIYRPDAPFTATWSLDPTQPVTVAESLAYTKDGRWDDFLALWYQNLSPTVGQWCHYIPPEQVLLDEAETITLTAQLDVQNILTLNWTPTDDESATNYWLYLDGPHDIGWKLRDTVDALQTSTLLSALAPGLYKLQVLARNDENEFVAQSNVVAAEIPQILSPEEVAIFLPFISR